MSIWRAAGLTRHVVVVDHTVRSHPEYEAYELLPRRLPAAAGIGVLMLGGAVGTYLAVAGGLSVLLAEDAAPPAGPLPAAVDSPTPAPPPTTASPAASTPGRDAMPSGRRPRGPARAPTPGAGCACASPPGPTPTTPPAPSPTVDPTTTGSPPTPTPTPKPTADPTDPPPGDGG